MLVIKSPSSDAYFNIASEEYILSQFEEDVFLLYINAPSIIVGRYQNTIAQLNLDYIQKNRIKVVRRLTGGGAVFHDQGNINFSFICKKDNYDDNTFQRYTKPIIHYLQSLRINAQLKGRNDLVIDDKKFSGNARLTTKTRILQHGTLLFSSQINDLTQALKADPLKFKDKAVKSIQSRVTNIADHLSQKISVQEFENRLVDHITDYYPQTIKYEFSIQDINSIAKLAEDKYSTWEWNFGYSPQYDFDKTIKTAGGIMEVRLQVKDGIIYRFMLNGDFFASQPIDPFIQAMAGCKHDKTEISNLLDKIKIEDYLININKDDLLCALF